MINRRKFLSLASATTAGAASVSLLPVAGHAHSGAAAFAAVSRFALGDWQVIGLSDGYLPLDTSILNHISAAEAQAMFEAAYSDPAHMQVNTNAYLVDTGSDLILIDTGTGPAFGPTLGGLSANLAAAGYAPSQITKVLATHLHPDHIGGCVVNGVNPFAGAELIVSETDHAFFTSAEVRAQAPEAFRGFFDLAQAAVSGFDGKVTLFSGEATVAPGITSVPLPGHTPGHVGFILESASESMLIWGDTLHIPQIQFARPDVTVAFDVDQEGARLSRERMLDRAATDRQLVAGMHMLFPGFGYVERASQGYRFVPTPWEFN